MTDLPDKLASAKATLTPEELAAKLAEMDMLVKLVAIGESKARQDILQRYEVALRHIDAREAGAWRPIAEAPKDGTHILAFSEHWTFAQSPPTVVHWFPDPDEPGFYTSVNEREPGHPFRATHWQPISPPKDTQ